MKKTTTRSILEDCFELFATDTKRHRRAVRKLRIQCSCPDCLASLEAALKPLAG